MAKKLLAVLLAGTMVFTLAACGGNTAAPATVKEKGLDINLCNYFWNVLVNTQRGYSFNLSHTLAYSLVGLQNMNLACNYPIIFWNTANLIVDSAGIDDEDNDDDEDNVEIEIDNDEDDIDEDEDEDDEEPSAAKETVKRVKKTVDYGKAARAIGKFKLYGINILPPDINNSSYTFTPDVVHNSITYGLRGITRISTDLIKQIIRNRPYSSFEDFMIKNHTNKLQTINLIKSGAFDAVEGIDRTNIMHNYLLSIADQKQRLTLQNMQMLINKDLIPENMAFYKKLFLFNKYLKTCKSGIYYTLNEAAINFISEHFDTDFIEDGTAILQKVWDNLYKKAMEPMRQYLKDNKDEMLKKLNDALFNEVADKYGKGNISKWEMDSISFYYHEHELAAASKDFDDFFTLSEEPDVEYSFPGSDGREVNIYRIHRIIGTVIDKNKLKNSISLLTPTGVVQVKIYKNQYALYDKQISEKDSEGKKHVLEKSWFQRGSMLMIQGIRRGDNFIPRKKKSSIYPVIAKIIDISPIGDLTYQYERTEVNN